MANRDDADQLEGLSMDFDKADVDKSGSLSFSEFFGVLKENGFDWTEERAKDVFSSLDKDGNDKISRDEFTNAMKKVPKMSMREFHIRRKFVQMDTDNSGSVTKTELKEGLERFGKRMNQQDVQNIQAAIDKDDGGTLSYEEFLKAYRYELTSSYVGQLFTKMDTDNNGTLTVDEILKTLNEGDPEIDVKWSKIMAVIETLEKKEDGKIRIDEFIKAYTSATC